MPSSSNVALGATVTDTLAPTVEALATFMRNLAGFWPSPIEMALPALSAAVILAAGIAMTVRALPGVS